MPDSWIGTIRLTNETEILDDNGVKIHDYISCDQGVGVVVNSNTHPVLAGKLPVTSSGDILQEGEREGLSVCYSGGDYLKSYLDFSNPSAPHNTTRYGNTYAKGIGVFEQKRANPPLHSTTNIVLTDLNVSELTYPLIVEGGIEGGAGNDVNGYIEWFRGGTSILRLRTWNSDNSNTVFFYRLEGAGEVWTIDPAISNKEVLVEVVGNKVRLSPQGGSVLLLDADLSTADSVKVHCQTDSTSTDNTRAGAWFAVDRSISGTEIPNIPTPTGSPCPYKIIADAK